MTLKQEPEQQNTQYQEDPDVSAVKPYKLASDTHETIEAILIDNDAELSALERKLQTLYQILDQLPIGVFAKDSDGRHLLVNRSLAKRSGRSPQEIIRNAEEDITPPELARLYRAEDNQILSGMKATIRSEINDVNMMGENRILRSQKWPLRDVSGHIIGVIGISEDITEERRQENEIKISQQQLALLFEHSPLAVIEWDLDGNITHWNPAGEKMFGIARSSAIGRPLTEVVFSREVSEYAETMRRLFRRERALVAQGGGSSTVLRIAQDGQDGQQYVRDWTFTILTQTQDIVVGFGAIVSDVTEQVRTQQQLEQALERLALFVEQVPVAIIEWDLNRVIQGWNPAAETIFGWSAAETIGKDALDLLVPQSNRAHVAHIFEQMLQTPEPIHSENANLTHDGREIICQWINIPLINEHGERVGLASLAQDVTDARHVQQQALGMMAAQARMTTLKQFVQSISHFFRNHLAQIEVNRHLMTRMVELGTQTNLLERLLLLRDSIQRMTEQLDNLTIISSIAVIEEDPLPLVQIVQDSFNALQRAADAKSLAYTFEAIFEAPFVRGDARALRDAFRRLLQNAIAYTPAGGRVSVRVRQEAGSVVVDVADNGIGMTEAQMAKVFDLFYRGETAASIDTGGLGLGLSVAKLAIENHRGRLNVTSQDGQGSTFSVRLPLV
jgi:PAS domain S-box-containing protein